MSAKPRRIGTVQYGGSWLPPDDCPHRASCKFHGYCSHDCPTSAEVARQDVLDKHRERRARWLR